jgi:hypothetical protein
MMSSARIAVLVLMRLEPVESVREAMLLLSDTVLGFLVTYFLLENLSFVVLFRKKFFI